MESKDFQPAKPRRYRLVRLSVKDLGFTRSATTDQLYKRALELGLELCPAEVGPHYRLQYMDQPMDEWVYVGMKEIAASDGDPHVFEVGRDADGAWLDRRWADPGTEWDPGDQFLFRLRKSKT